jgi:glutamyl-tRNA(Gln) amidotransferase subunit E
MDIFTLLKNDEIGKEAIEEFMIAKADNPNLTIEELKKELKIEKISEEDLKKIIQDVINKNLEVVKEKEMRAMGPLMGEVMKKVRGKIDGKIVSNELKILLQKKLKEME